MHNINNNNTQYVSQYCLQHWRVGIAGSLTRRVPGQPAASRSDRRRGTAVQMDCFCSSSCACGPRQAAAAATAARAAAALTLARACGRTAAARSPVVGLPASESG